MAGLCTLVAAIPQPSAWCARNPNAQAGLVSQVHTSLRSGGAVPRPLQQNAASEASRKGNLHLRTGEEKVEESTNFKPSIYSEIPQKIVLLKIKKMNSTKIKFCD